MATDLPDNVAQSLMTSSVTGFQLATEELRANAGNAANIIRHSAARRFDETDVTEGKTAAGVLATDVGGPTNPPRA